ncbi:MAG: YdcH family protein [Alphaproteobacteria bacterium]|nr:YdcH family protein [Alphaproteobacteria bacterium]
MSQQERLEFLKEKHAALDEAVQSESRRPFPDTMRVKELKLKKLRIKEEMSALTH